MQKDTDGKPVDKSYLEVGLPQFLQSDIDAYVIGEKEQSQQLDCLWGELYGSINAAFWGGIITEEQADTLRNKYLYDMEADDND